MKLGGKKVLILGLGISGFAAAELALDQGATVIAVDSGNGPSVNERSDRLRDRGAIVHSDFTPSQWQDSSVDLAVLSPGISPWSPMGRFASALSCPILGELAFGAAYCACPILAVTGTNGKTTTVELTVHCLRENGVKTKAAGNCGYPLSRAASESADLDFLVVEVSSFQLERPGQFKPIAAAILNVTSDHQDRYANFSDYVRTKLCLAELVEDSANVIFGSATLALPEFQKLSIGSTDQSLVVGVTDGDADYRLSSSGYLVKGERPLIHRDDLTMKGAHNVENVLTAIALCERAGIAPESAARAATSFAAGEHRLEHVGEYDGVHYVNDSKATNPDAVAKALKTCSEAGKGSGKIILIAGGRDKKMNFAPVDPWLGSCVGTVLLMGESRGDLTDRWSTIVDCRIADTLDDAVNQAIQSARTGDTVLLSPGCASQDMFDNYADRGNQFKNALKRRLGNMKETFSKRGTSLLAITAAAGIALLSGCNSVAKLENNTKGLDTSSSVPVAFSNNRSFFDLTDLQKEKAMQEQVVVDDQVLPPVMDLPPIGDIGGGRGVNPLPRSHQGNLLKYKVKKNDTLSHIAVAYKVGIDELAEWNNMNKKDILYVGKTLTLPPGAINPNGPVRKSGGNKNRNVRYYTVKKGDTLGHIALREKVSVADLKKWNNLKSDRINAGKKLALATGGKASKATNPKRNAMPRNGIHVVKPGQSLSTIAYRYGMSISELKRLNGLTTSHIVPDQKLYLRDGVANSSASTAKAWISPTQTKLENGDKYTVKKGDILGRIANTFGITAQRIMKANGLSSTLIRQGQVLVIPTTAGAGRTTPRSDTPTIAKKNNIPRGAAATTTVAAVKVNTDNYVMLPHFVDQQNDTLEIIAEMYGSKAMLIMAANPGIKTNSDLRSVKEISVPVEDLSVK